MADLYQFSEVAEEMHAGAMEHDELQALLAEVYEDESMRELWENFR